jgi:phosphoglycolate phosphatase
MFSPRVAAFDLDGTLLDSRPDIASACNFALEKSGRKPLAAEVITRYVGDGARRLCARASGLPDAEPQLDRILEDFLNYYLLHPAVGTTWMPHALETIEALEEARIPMAVVTNKPRAVARRVLEVFGIDKRFVSLVGGGDTEQRKPAAEPLLLAAKQMGVAPQELIMIGDGTQDVLAGRAAGCRTIAVRCGFTQSIELEKARPDIIVETLAEVPAIVERWIESTVKARIP